MELTKAWKQNKAEKHHGGLEIFGMGVPMMYGLNTLQT